MYREILYSLIGHGIVFGGLMFPSLLDMKPKMHPTVIAVRAVSSSDIQQLIQKSTAQGTPKPKIPQQAQVEKDKALPNKNWRPRQTAKSDTKTQSKDAETSKSTTKSGKTPVQGIKVDQEFEYPDYLIQMRTKIEENWRPPTLRAAIMTRVFFRVARDGKITRTFVEIKTGNIAFDMSCMNAVIASQPFDPLPDDFPGDSIGIHMDFIYEM